MFRVACRISLHLFVFDRHVIEVVMEWQGIQQLLLAVARSLHYTVLIMTAEEYSDFIQTKT